MSRTTDKAKNQIKALIAGAVAKAQAASLLPEAEPAAFLVEVPADRNNGDYSTNAAMVNARAFRLAPRKIAEIIAENASLEGLAFFVCFSSIFPFNPYMGGGKVGFGQPNPITI